MLTSYIKYAEEIPEISIWIIKKNFTTFLLFIFDILPIFFILKLFCFCVWKLDSFFKKTFIYFTASGLSFGMRDLSLWCVDFPVVACGPPSCGTGSHYACACSVVLCGLSCPVACGVSAPQPGIKALSPALQGRFLTTEASAKSQGVRLLYSRRSISWLT